MSLFWTWIPCLTKNYHPWLPYCSLGKDYWCWCPVFEWFEPWYGRFWYVLWFLCWWVMCIVWVVIWVSFDYRPIICVHWFDFYSFFFFLLGNNSRSLFNAWIFSFQSNNHSLTGPYGIQPFGQTCLKYVIEID